MTQKGYIIQKYRVIRQVHEYLRELTDGLNEQTYQLFAHILVCTLLKWREGDISELFLPIASKLIRKKIGRNTEWRDLHDRGLITIRPFCKEQHKARRYRAQAWVIDAICEVTAKLSYYEQHVAEKVNLMTGEPYPFGKLIESRLTYDNDSRNRLPKDYRANMKELGRNWRVFNWAECERVIRKQREKMDRLEAELEQVQSVLIEWPDRKLYKEIEKEWLKAKRQWQNNHLCFLAVLNRQPQQLTKDFWQYHPRYNYSKFGRTYEEHGGFQSASKELRQASIKGLENVYEQIVYNNDLKACHLNALRLLCKRWGLDKTWLDAKLSDEHFREDIAERLGLPVSAVKKVLNALVNGAPVPKRVTMPPSSPKHGKKFRENSIQKMLREAVGHDKARIKVVLNKLTAELQPLIDILESFHVWIETKFIPSTKNYTKPSATDRTIHEYIRNEYGFIYYLDELPQRENDRRSQLAAFFFQGIEARFVAILTCLGPKYGYRVIANEHDGVLSVGWIPDKAIDEAIQETGFEYAALDREKDFIKKAA
jgi:hypothetical protein